MIRGDLAKSPVEQMQALVNGVFIPVLRNPNNSSAWPAVVSEDVINHAQALRSTTEVLCGRMKGEMPLPMPMGTEVIDMQLSAEEAHAAASAASAASGGENGEIRRFLSRGGGGGTRTNALGARTNKFGDSGANMRVSTMRTVASG